MDMSISTRTSLQSRDEYETKYKAMHPSNRGSNLYGAFAFDAVMSIAVTLNKSIELLNGTRLEDFTYERADMTALFKNLLETTVFDGLTVRRLWLLVLHLRVNTSCWRITRLFSIHS